MSDNGAVMKGYTRHVMADAEAGMTTLFLLIKPDTDLDSSFKAWDTDQQEWVKVNGWLFTFEQLDEG